MQLVVLADLGMPHFLQLKKALYNEHVLNARALEVKMETPKEETKAPSKKMTWIFVARIHPSVTKDVFRKYVEAYWNIEYLPGNSKRILCKRLN